MSVVSVVHRHFHEAVAGAIPPMRAVPPTAPTLDRPSTALPRDADSRPRLESLVLASYETPEAAFATTFGAAVLALLAIAPPFVMTPTRRDDARLSTVCPRRLLLVSLVVSIAASTAVWTSVGRNE